MSSLQSIHSLARRILKRRIGRPKLALKGDVRDTVCPLNPRDYYLIDFTDPSMQTQGGVLTGKVTVSACVPGMRIGLVYHDPAGPDYDSYQETAGSTDGIALPVHIPNSVITGSVAEKCYVRVQLPLNSTSNVPYHLTSNLTYDITNCGDPISTSTVGAPDIPFAAGMVQGVLCDPNQMDWYRLETLGPDATPGHVTGDLTVDIEYPKPLPGDAITSVSLRDENGTLLAKLYSTLPPTRRL